MCGFVCVCFCIFGHYLQTLIFVFHLHLRALMNPVCMRTLYVFGSKASCQLHACVCVCVTLYCTSLHLHNSRRSTSKQLFFPSTPRCEFLTFTRPEGKWEGEHKCVVFPLLSLFSFFTTLPCAWCVSVCVGL